MAGKDALLLELIKPVVEALELQLWGVEYLAHAKQTVVRIYIDSPKGIDVDDCAAVSRQVSSVFDVEDPIAGEYTLEVSSPGMARPLFSLEQYQIHKGDMVKIKLRVAYEGRRNFTGQLVGVEDEDVVIVVDDHEYLLPFEMIDKANIVPQF
ncbi:ribosome maturation factor RimP [Dasania sp. GY-MA-18]|uniref:Ribosome maturation factor RimP n=1 Tax=Dasania phycosphaerae TaxID=2950436 RepID=A0A9J6RH63_9GAMM|nr:MULTISPECIES: ribosome maturation factor RimP [Dasania]MCR8921237.1 ribosome maturation factor RimP [Dasania sp. GY-MA-18]MCZ0863665.1 ribosome maturation factor RimP [Dasania phycosphaerae]MCZ0867393.1 ribosome maturation factor RimP [Dasania phycosphaerae]